MPNQFALSIYIYTHTQSHTCKVYNGEQESRLKNIQKIDLCSKFENVFLDNQ